jgi:hypothetical protein
MKIDVDIARALIVVDDVKITFELLKEIAHPDPTKAFYFVKNGDVVTVKEIK